MISFSNYLGEYSKKKKKNTRTGVEPTIRNFVYGTQRSERKEHSSSRALPKVKNRFNTYGEHLLISSGTKKQFVSVVTVHRESESTVSSTTTPSRILPRLRSVPDDERPVGRRWRSPRTLWSQVVMGVRRYGKKKLSPDPLRRSFRIRQQRNNGITRCYEWECVLRRCRIVDYYCTVLFTVPADCVRRRGLQ